ncbi:MAG: serine hydrolase [Fidelibacterota bacterium]|nr:MAG: serine hydrolase [Candidatus Neomarinimicrobiota bacterium]
MTSRREIMPLLMTAVLLLISCQGKDPVAPDLPAPPVPDLLDDGWAVSSLEAQGIDPRPVALLSEEIRSGDFEEIHSLVIVRRGYLVFEEYYYPGHDAYYLHRLASVTKSVISLLVGCAIEQGFISGHEQPLPELFPGLADIFAAEPAKAELTLRHALTMSSGLRWKDGIAGDPASDAHAMDHDTNSVRYVLSKPLDHKPGSRFHYTSMPTVVAGAIRNSSGMSVQAFADAALFGPLGITDYRWEFQSDSLVRADGGLHLTARALARLGQLCLDKGVWAGQRILPEDWMELSSREWIEATAGHYYGFLWWLRPSSGVPGFRLRSKSIYFGSGYGGQKLFVVPEYDLVVAVFGSDNELEDKDDQTVSHFVLYNILEAIRDQD